MTNSTFSFLNVKELDFLVDKNVQDTSQTLIQVFCATTVYNEIQKIHKYFQNNYSKSIIIGTTTDGIIDGASVYTNTRHVVTFTKFEKTTLKSSLVKHKQNHDDSFLSGVSLAKELLSNTTKVIISFADGIHTNGEEFANGISSICPEITLSGGLSADNGELVKTYLFDKNEIISDGAVGVSLNNTELNVSTSYTFDWMPIGKKLRITKAIKNRVYEIDGISAVDIYAKYLGQELAHQLPQVGIEFPLIFEKNGVTVGRAVLFKHDDGSLTFAGNIQEGDSVRFGVGSVETILKNSDYNTRKMILESKFQVDAIFVYSCMARRRFMNEYISQELKTLSSVSDISGFFTYGEFFHFQDSNQLLNETMTILAISEDNRPPKNILSDSDDYSSHHSIVKTEHVLANLANTVSSELAQLNESLEERIKESSDYIYKQAYFDRLTGLPNRLSLIKRLDDSLGQILLLVNIDDFTTINDFYGHETGDKVLVRLSNLLVLYSHHENAEVFKLPSDEFAIIMDLKHSRVSIENRIKKCIDAITHESFMINGHSMHISVTISAASINGNKTGLPNADMALKLAKKASKEYMIFHEDLKLAKQYEDNIKIANVIRNAIFKSSIVPYFQPIFDLKTEKVEKYEALVRLIEEDGTVLSPYAFLEISQKIKLYSQITEIMIDKTFNYFAKNGFNFSINLSFSDILNEKTSKYLFSKIQECNIASQLTIEILETQANDNESQVEAFIQNIYTLGAKIAIDDFGSGYANFQHITRIKSDYMKIDGSLIKNIDKDENARLVVETIVVFARKLHKKTIAEFVHSKEVYDVVKSLDIDYAQGYYLGMPQESTI